MNSRVPLTLFTHVSSITPYANWFDPNNPSDPWTGYPYQWQVNLTITSQSHSDPYTPRPFSYNGLDVSVGNWLIFTAGGIAVEIVSISSQSDNTLTVIVEDVSLNNIINDTAQNGVGIGNISPPNDFDCLIIGLNNEGIPVFASLSDYSVPINLISDITNRFQFHNYIQDFIFGNQPGHNFKIGDVIYLNSDGSFSESISTSARSTQSIGTITSINLPDVGNFTYRPIGRYVTNLPTLPGYPGDLLYVSSTIPGGVTNTVTSGETIPIYIKISDTSAIFTSGTGGGGGLVPTGQVAFGGTFGQITGNTTFTYNPVSETLSIGNISISSEYITTTSSGVPLILSANSANVQVVTPLDMTGNRIINTENPVDPQDVATKSYVDAVASGLNTKESVVAATTQDLNANFTTTVANGCLTSKIYESLIVDGYQLSVDDRVLVKDQADERQNGIYVVIQDGQPGQIWQLNRSLDFNGIDTAGKVQTGDFVFVQRGNTNISTGWVMNTPGVITVNSSDIHWVQFSSAGVVQPGFGLTQTGNTFDVNVAVLIDNRTGFATVQNPQGYDIIEFQIDGSSPLIFNNNALSISNSIANTGLTYTSGSLSVNTNQPQITGLGTITSGVWNGTPIDYQHGGTGVYVLGSPGQVLGVDPSGTFIQWITDNQFYESPEPSPTPSSLTVGDRWYDTNTGIMFTYINDDNGNHWVEL
jgi:hypothetical protein